VGNCRNIRALEQVGNCWSVSGLLSRWGIAGVY
jgi:hypothetical protein